jgi:hypothetical protein
MKVLTSVLIIGFLMLAVFGFIQIGPNNQSAVSCVATSVASVACPNGSGLASASHNIGAFTSVTSAIFFTTGLSSLLLFTFLVCGCLNIFSTSLLGRTVSFARVSKFSLINSFVRERQSSWLSLFVLSPNN